MTRRAEATHSGKATIPGSTTVSPARLAAFDVLRRVAEQAAFASVLLASKEEELQPNDRALCHELVMGVLRRQLWLDRLVSHYSNRDAERLDLPVLITLRLGLYQLRFLSRIPPSAAVSESVNLVRFARLRSADVLVNAVLRRATREPDYDPLAAISDPVGRLAVEASHPLWLLERWIDDFGFAQAAAFARANNEPPAVVFRVVHSQAKEAEVLAVLRTAGATLSPGQIVTDAWLIKGGRDALNQLVQEGRVYIQEEASQLVGRALGARARDRVLDVCAAPGSKTTQIADLAPDALVVAGELHEHRLRTVIGAVALQGLRNVRCLVFDGLQNLPFADGSFDRVLVDAPCSGTGTLRRNPEIRWRISPDDIRDLAGKQIRLLCNASRVVKPGGWLVYSTCSVEREENEALVSELLQRETNFALEPADSSLGAPWIIQTWPHRHGTDGFFIAVLRRRK